MIRCLFTKATRGLLSSFFFFLKKKPILSFYVSILTGTLSRSNWNLEMLVCEERGKPEYPEKNLLEQEREPTTNSTHMTPIRGIEPGSHLLEVNVFTTHAIPAPYALVLKRLNSV